MAGWPRQACGTAGLQLAPARAALVAVAVFAIAAAALAGLHARGGAAERLSRSEAVAAALDDASVRRELARSGYSRERVTPVDDRLVRVSFFDGSRIVLDAAVAPDGRVTNQILYGPRFVRIGGETSQRPLVLALLVAVFALATVTLPLWSVRNLDVLALASFVVPVLLMNARLLEASVYTSYPPLAYLCLRCAAVAFRPGLASPPGKPALRAPRRVLAVAAGTAAIALLVLTIPGGAVSDIGYASLAGATEIVHGTLPYGHLLQGELVHGDTYPLLAYVAYVPAALVTPVRSGFDQLDGALWIAAAFALAGAVAMYRVGGLRLAIAWLCFPPVVIAASAGSNDVVAAACVAWAVALIARGGRSAAALAIAGWVKLAPLAAVPLWVLRERGRGLLGALAVAVAVTGAVAAAVIALGGLDGLGDMADALSFQADRGSLLSIWTLAGAEAAQVAVQAAVVTLLVVGTIQVRRDPALARDPRRVAALAAAVLLGIQLGANYWTYAYLPWVFPLIAFALLAERRATS